MNSYYLKWGQQHASGVEQLYTGLYLVISYL